MNSHKFQLFGPPCKLFDFSKLQNNVTFISFNNCPCSTTFTHCFQFAELFFLNSWPVLRLFLPWGTPLIPWRTPRYPRGPIGYLPFFFKVSFLCPRPFFVKQGPPETPLKVPLTSYKVSNWCYKVSLWGPKVSYPPSRYHLYRFFWNFFFHFLKTHNIIHNSLNVKCKLVIDHYIY